MTVPTMADHNEPLAQWDRATLALFAERDVNKLLDGIVGFVPKAVNAEGCSIFLRDSGQGDFELRSTTGLVDKPKQRVTYKHGEGLTGWVCQKKRPLRVKNVKDANELRAKDADLVWSKKYSEIESEQGFAYLGVPLVSQKDEALGALRVCHKLDMPEFSAYDEKLLMAIAARAALALENLSYYEAETRQAGYFRLIADVANDLASSGSLSLRLARVCKLVAEAFHAETCEVYLRDPQDENHLVMRGAHGVPSHLIGRAERRVGEGITGWIVANMATVRSENILQDSRYRGKYRTDILPHLREGDRRTFLGVPLRVERQAVGVVKLYNKIGASGNPGLFTAQDQSGLEAVAQVTTLGIESARYMDSIRDMALEALRVQRLASLGTLAIRIPGRIENSLATARMTLHNLERHLRKNTIQDQALLRVLDEKLCTARDALAEVDKSIDNLRDYSHRAGFVKVVTKWSAILDQAVLFVRGLALTKTIEIDRDYEAERDLPDVFLEPGEVMEAVVAILQALIYQMKSAGGSISISAGVSRDGNYLSSEFAALEGGDDPPGEAIAQTGDIEPGDYGNPHSFALEIAKLSVETGYGGSLRYESVSNVETHFSLELQIRRGWTK